MAVKILFICSGNTCRSPLAEMIARRILSEHNIPAEVSSAGILTYTGMSWSEHSLKIAEEDGLDSLGHTATQLTAEHLEAADLILVMANRHLRQIWERFPGMDLTNKLFLLKQFTGIAEFGNEEVLDPYGENLVFYRLIAKELERALANLPEKLRQHRLI